MVTSLAAPARANGAASTRTIAGIAAVLIGIATAVNVSHKRQAANTVEGYLPDGSVVYADGRVVSPNGNTWYPGNQGEQIACNGQSCVLTSNGNGQYNNGQYNNGQYNNGQYNNGQYNNGQYNNDQYNNGQYNNGQYNGQYNNGQYNDDIQYNGNSRNVRKAHGRNKRDDRGNGNSPSYAGYIPHS